MSYLLSGDTFADNVCLNTIKAWQMIGMFVYILKVLVPVILIIFAVKPIFNVIMKGTSAEVNASLKSFSSKLFIAILVFVAPSIIASFISLFVDSNHPFRYCHECLKFPFSDVCADYIDKFNQMVDDDAQKVSGSQKVTASNTADVGGKKETTGEGGGLVNTDNIIIGDSRTVGMCAAITGSSIDCSYKSAPKIYNNDVFIALGSTGYSWFKSDALSYVDKVLISNKDKKYNIFSLMGVNYLLNDIDKYETEYPSLANNSWKDHKLILVSVNPVDEVKEKEHGYRVKNSNIELFNERLEKIKADNIVYCDIYSQIKNDFSTTDGLHYSTETSKKIYNLMMNCI